METSDWVECAKCHQKTRLFLGHDSKNHSIIGPCRPCMIRDREAGAATAVFSGICDECGTKTKLIEVDGVMTCPRCQTEYRNLSLPISTEEKT